MTQTYLEVIKNVLNNPLNIVQKTFEHRLKVENPAEFN